VLIQAAEKRTYSQLVTTGSVGARGQDLKLFDELWKILWSPILIMN